MQMHPTQTLQENVTYTIILTDPDATSRANPVMGEMCHWIVSARRPKIVSAQTAVISSSWRAGALLDGQAVGNPNVTQLITYLPPSPPPKTGLHRYVFVLLVPADSEGVDAKEYSTPKERPHWGYGKVGKGVRDWAEENGLVAVGEWYRFLKAFIRWC